MRGSALEVRTTADGSVVIAPHGEVGLDRAVELRQVLVHTVRRVRPLRLILDLADVPALDPINVGTVAAACGLGDDHQVAVFVHNPCSLLAEQLTAAGVPRQRMRQVPAEPAADRWREPSLELGA
jgi:anti-anti-sigma regulatory factor